MNIYTRMGDGGESGVKGGRLPKSAPVFDVLGDLDELGSQLGLVKAHLGGSAEIDDIQDELMAISADLAGYTPYGEERARGFAAMLEKRIDMLMNKPFDGFVRPGSSIANAQAHVARAVCRRAERSLVKYSSDHVGKIAVNRLSDYLFALACSL